MTRQRAFSLVELLVVLAVAIIVLALAIPDMRAMIRQHQLKTAVRDLYNALDLARSQAMARGERVMLAPLDPNDADWSGGWIIFVDRNGDQRYGPADEAISSHGPVSKGISIIGAFSSQQPGKSYLAYNSAGRSCSATSSMAARWGAFALEQGDQQRRIVINMLGRARVCDPLKDRAQCGASP